MPTKKDDDDDDDDDDLSMMMMMMMMMINHNKSPTLVLSIHLDECQVPYHFSGTSPRHPGRTASGLNRAKCCHSQTKMKRNPPK